MDVMTRKEKIESQKKLIQTGNLQCNCCQQVLPVENFYKNPKQSIGYNQKCKKCVHTTVYLANKDAYLQKVKTWQQSNKEKVKKYRLKNQAKQKNNPNKILYSIRTCARKEGNIYLHIMSSEELIGCTTKQLIQHVEAQLKPGMTWENYGDAIDQWQIDHIIPLVAFNLKKESHVKWANNFKNLQPLWSGDNLKKRDFLPNGKTARECIKEMNSEEYRTMLGQLLRNQQNVNVEEFVKSWETN